MTDDVKKIVRDVAEEVTRRIRRTRYVMTRPDVAEALGLQRQSSTLDKILADPTFPRPIELAEGTRKRWRTKDVEAWLDSLSERQSDLAMHVRR